MFIHVTLYMYVIYVLPGYKTYACVFNAGATPKHVPVNQCLWRWALAPVVFQAMQVTLMMAGSRQICPTKQRQRREGLTTRTQKLPACN